MHKCWLMVLTVFVGPAVYAHGGGLNAAGCHNDRKNGGYHCHRGSRRTAAFLASPAKRKRAVSKIGRGVTKAQALFDRTEVYFANCSQARTAGAAPVRYGRPGYARHLDRDGDGIGCE